MIFGIGHEDITLVGNGDAARLIKFAEIAPRDAIAGDKFSLGRESRNPVIAVFAKKNGAVGSQRDVVGKTELARPGADRSDLAQKSAVGIEALNPMVGGIGDVDNPIFIHRNCHHAVELARPVAQGSPLAEEAPLWVKDVDPLGPHAVFGNVISAIGSLDNSGGINELFRSGSIRSPPADDFAPGGVFQNLAVMRIRHENYAFFIETDVCWSSIFLFRRHPTPQKFSVAGEDLHSAGFIDDVDFMIVNANGSGEEEGSATGSLFAPCCIPRAQWKFRVSAGR